MLPLQEEEMGHLGQLHEAASSAPLTKLGPARAEIEAYEFCPFPPKPLEIHLRTLQG